MRNVLFITTDQQRFDSLGCNGSAVAKTPHLDELAAEGCCFKNHFVANPVCSPSRGSIWTGEYPSRHGLWANGGTLPTDLPTIPQTFNAHGFQTAHFGKLHLVPILNRVDPHPHYGFQVCEVAEGDQQYPPHDAYFNWLRQRAPMAFAEYLEELYTQGQTKGYTSKLPEELHLSTWLTQRTRHWLEAERNPEQPFFLSVGFFDPHHAFNPVEPYASAFKEADLPMPPDDPAFFEGKPPHYRKRSDILSHHTRDPQKMGATQRAYHAMVHHVDACIGQLLQTLDQLGLRETTTVVFTSDHGELLGDHGMLWKGPFLLDSLLRVPLIIRSPGLAPKDVTELTSAVDFYSTLPALAGLSIADPRQGLPMLNAAGETFPTGHHEEIYAEWDEPGNGPTRTVRCLRNQNYKLILYPGREVGEFYDLQADPGEIRNLYGASEKSLVAAREAMQDRLLHHYHRERPDVAISPGW